MPQLIGCGGLVMELIGCLDDDEGRVGDQVVGLEQAADGRYRNEVALGIGKLTTSSRDDNSDSLRGKSTIRRRTSSGMQFQIRPGPLVGSSRPASSKVR